MLDGFRLAVGTLTVLPVPFHGTVDRRTARWAMLLAPLAVLPLGMLVGLVVWAGQHLHLPDLATGLLVVGALALGSRALHLDGLSDVADALTASYDPERSLAVMKSGTSGPAGTVALIVVLGLQVVGVGGLVGRPHGFVVIGALVCLSRAALVLTCVRGVPAARSDGLGSPFAGVVPRTSAAAVWLVVALATEVLWVVLDEGEQRDGRGIVAALVALAALTLLVLRVVRRFGGVTGDVYGAAIELTLAVLLLGLAAAGPLVYVGSYSTVVG